MTAVLIPLCILGFIVLAFVDRATEHAAERREAARRARALREWHDNERDLGLTDSDPLGHHHPMAGRTPSIRSAWISSARH
jgi:hypothetical protein